MISVITSAKEMFKSSLTLLASPSDPVKRDENSVAMTIILEGVS